MNQEYSIAPSLHKNLYDLVKSRRLKSASFTFFNDTDWHFWTDAEDTPQKDLEVIKTFFNEVYSGFPPHTDVNIDFEINGENIICNVSCNLDLAQLDSFKDAWNIEDFQENVYEILSDKLKKLSGFPHNISLDLDIDKVFPHHRMSLSEDDYKMFSIEINCFDLFNFHQDSQVQDLINDCLNDIITEEQINSIKKYILDWCGSYLESKDVAGIVDFPNGILDVHITNSNLYIFRVDTGFESFHVLSKQSEKTETEKPQVTHPTKSFLDALADLEGWADKIISEAGLTSSNNDTDRRIQGRGIDRDSPHEE